ncbi:hypothetical protein GCM10011385_41160 [Nitratireductor aestuarii]|uniref:Phage integrase family protein n=2 Tax=Nitratireductor aestuarii TaxID=1735103 RepID=A0A916WBB2_9HYPH|nr:hypothetical protein GCM10011385_41160 [Nitratireductor aestuarii]
MVARRLNALLLQMELVSKARMATKEQLAKIFTLEIQAMHEQIENLDRAAKRHGSLRDPVHRDADRQVGLAYRLLESYGSLEELNFDPGSETHEALLDAGATDADIPFIAETFRAEREEALSDRAGEGRTAFMRDVLHRMAQVGLDDTVLNREAAAEEIYRARADALLESADDPRKPSLKGRPSRRQPTPVETDPVAPPPKPSIMWAHEAEDPVVVKADVAYTEPPVAPPSPPPPAEPHNTVAFEPPAPMRTPAASSGRARKNLPIPQFDEEIDKLVANNRDQWEDDTASDVRVLIGIFRGILEEHGVTHSGQITQEHVAALRQHFNHILPGWGRSPKLRSLSPLELRKTSQKAALEAEVRGKPIKLGLSAATIRRHLGNLDHFLKHLRASYYAIGEWTFDGLRPKKPKRGEIRLQQDKPGPDDVRPLFDMPIFTGRLSAEQPELPGEQVYHCANYYLPMFLTYLGPRRNEFAGLMVKDVVQMKDGSWAIQIRRNDVRRIKNAQSHRLLPIPDELIRLNFLDYVEQVKQLGYDVLFPELFSSNAKKIDPGERFYKGFIPVAEKCFPGELWKRPLHAFRHGFADTLKQAGVSEGYIEDLSGRLGSSETSTRYTNPAGLPLLRAIIAHYPVITGHLEPRPIKLLPWVEKKLPPPGAGKTKAERFGCKRGRKPKRTAESLP